MNQVPLVPVAAGRRRTQHCIANTDPIQILLKEADPVVNIGNKFECRMTHLISLKSSSLVQLPRSQ